MWQQPAGNPPAFPAGNPPTAVRGQQLLFSFSLMANTRQGLVSRNSPQQPQQKYPAASKSAAIITDISSRTFAGSASCYKHIRLSSCPAPTHFLTFPTSFPLLPFLSISLFPPEVKEANKQKAIQGNTRAERNSTALQECSITFYQTLIFKDCVLRGYSNPISYSSWEASIIC